MANPTIDIVMHRRVVFGNHNVRYLAAYKQENDERHETGDEPRQPCPNDIFKLLRQRVPPTRNMPEDLCHMNVILTTSGASYWIRIGSLPVFRYGIYRNWHYGDSALNP